MSPNSMNFVFLGLSITSSWGNGHATTYRSLIRELCRRGHNVLFLERDVPWYATNRDLPNPPYGKTELYTSIDDLKKRFTPSIQKADVVIVGSYVPQGALIGSWVVQTTQGIPAFYDIDTPVTLAQLEKGDTEYLTRELISQYQLYLSFTGGPILKKLENQYRSPLARPLYCSVDAQEYFPEQQPLQWDLGYLGTYSDDRQPTLDRFLIRTSQLWQQGKFIVAGSQYPDSIAWGPNIDYVSHLAPHEHRRFYNNLRYALNVTRADMIQAGFSPSVRLFEAAACGATIISDFWPGLESIFEVNSEILVAKSTDDVMHYLQDLPDHIRLDIGKKARAKVLSAHTSSHRVIELENHIREAREKQVKKNQETRTSSWNQEHPSPFLNPYAN